MSQPYTGPNGSATSSGEKSLGVDLFGVPLATPPKRRGPAPGPPAEWPAAGTAGGDRTAAPPRRRSPAAPPSASSPPDVDLAGTYSRTGATLTRGDGVALVVCASHKPVLGARESDRYVRVASPSRPGAPRHAGDLYPARYPGACDLDGAHFQDGPGGTRYRIARLRSGGTMGDGAPRYSVEPAKRRRRGASA